ncbi:Golgi transport complex subunit 6 [Cichlidogyrus casuarinus]|uniref:Conserved oligomeric Golgi complex subunit 6 n=1 Tax=Cichlidogyrus casuarinus TaxID=1844966 RepID=A0ABD2QM44_9PLAT
MQALDSFVSPNGNQLQQIVADDRRFVFLSRNQIILVAVSYTNEPLNFLVMLLNYLYNQILFTLTLKVIETAFERSKNLDLRMWLVDCERHFEGITRIAQTSCGPFLGAVTCVPVALNIRDAIASGIIHGIKSRPRTSKSEDVVFGILFCDGSLVSFVRMKNQYLHPMDIHLLISLIKTTKSFKDAETNWLPNQFAALQQARCTIKQKLSAISNGTLFESLIKTPRLTLSQFDESYKPVRHFVFKYSLIAQYVSSDWGAPYRLDNDHSDCEEPLKDCEKSVQDHRVRVMSAYRRLHSRFHSSQTEPLINQIFESYEVDAFFAWTNSNPLKSKLVRILDRNLQEDDRFISALKVLSCDGQVPHFKDHRALKQQINELHLKSHHKFLAILENLEKQTNQLDARVEDVSDKWTAMDTELQEAQLKTQDLVHKTRKMYEELTKVHAQRVFSLKAYQLFSLSPLDQELLKGELSSKSLVNLDEYLAALNRAKDVCKNVTQLAEESSAQNKSRAQATVNTITLLIETAYESMYRWAKDQFRLQNKEIIELSPSIRRFMQELYVRNHHFTLLMEEYATARRMGVQQAFIDALTGSSKSSLRPIEVQSHDPQRYLGDMLAWLHQSLMIEREALLNLTKECVDFNRNLLIDTMDRMTEGLARPFRMRVSQVFSQQDQVILLYKIHGLFVFYHATMQDSLQSKKTLKLIDCIAEEKEFVWRLFMGSLQQQVTFLDGENESSVADPITYRELQPSTYSREMFKLLANILSVPQMNREDQAAKEELEARISKILVVLLDSTLKYFDATKIHLGEGTKLTPKSLVYIINSLNWAENTLQDLIKQCTIESYIKVMVQERISGTIQNSLSAASDALVNAQSRYILNRLGLSSLYSLLAEKSPNANSSKRLLAHNVSVHGPLAQRTDLPQGINVSEPHIRELLANFDGFLVNPDKLDFPEWDKLSVGKIKAKLKTQTSQLLIQAYSTIYNNLLDPRNGYSFQGDETIRSVEQVANLLS